MGEMYLAKELCVFLFREDLQYWTAENQSKMQDAKLQEEHAKIAEMVNQVKGQQSHIMARLHNEQLSLEKDLQSGLFKVTELYLFYYVSSYNTNVPQ